MTEQIVPKQDLIIGVQSTLPMTTGSSLVFLADQRSDRDQQILGLKEMIRELLAWLRDPIIGEVTTGLVELAAVIRLAEKMVIEEPPDGQS